MTYAAASSLHVFIACLVKIVAHREVTDFLQKRGARAVLTFDNVGVSGPCVHFSPDVLPALGEL